MVKRPLNYENRGFKKDRALRSHHSSLRFRGRRGNRRKKNWAAFLDVITDKRRTRVFDSFFSFVLYQRGKIRGRGNEGRGGGGVAVVHTFYHKVTDEG